MADRQHSRCGLATAIPRRPSIDSRHPGRGCPTRPSSLPLLRRDSHRGMKFHSDPEKRTPADGYVAAPLHLTQNVPARPWTIALLPAVRSAFGLVSLKPHHDRGAMDGSLRALKASTGMAEVEHSGTVLLRLVEIRPLNRRAAGKALILSFLLIMSLHDRISAHAALCPRGYATLSFFTFPALEIPAACLRK